MQDGEPLLGTGRRKRHNTTPTGMRLGFLDAKESPTSQHSPTLSRDTMLGHAEMLGIGTLWCMISQDSLDSQFALQSPRCNWEPGSHYLLQPPLTIVQLCRDSGAISRANSPPRLQLPRHTRFPHEDETCDILVQFGSIDECHETTPCGCMQVFRGNLWTTTGCKSQACLWRSTTFGENLRGTLFNSTDGR
ncbi:hypothetical protein LX32DRAFT_147466 [Colletotrichum zoysiae]|uniref:Uncharacterized protein n=1 Tax=Colletotrichum zoysiae TaxID=1216348 RepID=A0AAD9H7V4_9PEZI|nr:hypothetical protein LX32DRAFT_147466 [Colletotrichum zoysiae]